MRLSAKNCNINNICEKIRHPPNNPIRPTKHTPYTTDLNDFQGNWMHLASHMYTKRNGRLRSIRFK